MKTKGLLTSIAVVFFVLMFLVPAAVAVPQTINYQGYLEDSGGTPVNGTVSMDFAIYNVPTGGTVLWSETQSSVTVTEGAFSVTLGINNAIDLTFDDQYYLGVNVNGDGEMLPRAVLVSVPYAMRAGTADTAVSAQTADTAVTLEDKTLSDLVALLDGRYGNLGDSLIADFSAALPHGSGTLATPAQARSRTLCIRIQRLESTRLP
jgi:hypothetical protein